MRHFGMSKSEVIEMFSKMHVARLDHDTPVTMYSVPVGGAIKSHHTVMHKGEPVFEDADGNVVLKLKCGNPVVGGREHTEVAFAPEPTDVATVLRPIAPAIDVMPAPTDAIATILPPETPTDVTELVPQKTAVIENITNNTTNVTNVSGGSVKGLGALLVAVPLAAFLGTIIDHHGGCNCPTPTPTPEPVSMTLLAAGTIGLVAKRRRSRA
jgi:hypothetical protein